MQLVALVSSPDHVCCRYRLEAFRPRLEQAGHGLTLCPLPAGSLARWKLFRRLTGACVLIQRQLLPAWQLSLLRRNTRLLLFDLDDAIFLRDSYDPRGLHHPRKERRFARTVQVCDRVIAGNGFLAAETSRHTDPERVSIIPTCVDPGRYPDSANSPSGSDGRSLVWIGSSSTLQGLEAIAPLLEQLGRTLPGLRLRIICDRFPTFEHLSVVPIPWSSATEAKELAASDIGIAWVPDDLWSRGKCGLKVLQYMAAGLPVVANPVGVHCEMVVEGETGYLPTSPEQWCQAIDRLAGDPGLRSRLGLAGRQRFVKRYSVSAGADRWLELLDQLEPRRQAA